MWKIIKNKYIIIAALGITTISSSVIAIHYATKAPKNKIIYKSNEKEIKNLKQKIQEAEKTRQDQILSLAKIKDNFTKHITDGEKLSSAASMAYWNVKEKIDEIIQYYISKLNELHKENENLKKSIEALKKTNN